MANFGNCLKLDQNTLKANLGQVFGIDENGKTLHEDGGALGMTRFKNNSLMSDHVLLFIPNITQKKIKPCLGLAKPTSPEKLELVGIICNDSCIAGQYNRLFCPQCKGGQSMKRSLSLHIIQDGDFAMWRCFRANCGWAGQAFADSNNNRKVLSSEQMTEKSLGLEPLGDKAST
ncbi:hypothetical protein Patl1_11549 [Pistacia atlantica]|uniref:Uncharacterized protein n=1 Tax=Pistacia atlantica TaxID=434234 RepID=A0ACC1A4X5_9ROSI|nr:hypothetical protein Patl1_11549 [Pistacia atlantica]